MKNKKPLFIVAVFLLFVILLAGCSVANPASSGPTQPEEQTAEEFKTGVKRLTSINLSEYEKIVKDFVEGIQTKDTAKIAKTMGAPDTFEDGLSDWVMLNDFEKLQNAPLSNITVRTEKSGTTAKITTEVLEVGGVYKFTLDYVSGEWLLTPEAGLLINFTFKSPVKDVKYKDILFSDYIINSENNSTVWTFQIPRFVSYSDSPEFLITTELGEFVAKIHAIGNSELRLLAKLTEESEKEYLEEVNKLLSSIWLSLKNGEPKDNITGKVLSDKILGGCYGVNDIETEKISATFSEVVDVKLYKDDFINGAPKEYIINLSGTNGVKLYTKYSLETTKGEVRQKAEITMKKTDDAWKIEDIIYTGDGNYSQSFFLSTSTFNPRW